ncbi:murein biosynthesis integral membrane protein MurJ [Streptomyces sp. CBMA29]|uniref:murein biosynthesis integral membrane protein MurJ n=1 Tax=Streptomyces sp. CBMA29 TaxID=1896314 RepID=UPI001661D8D3|nr:lipid II flippase MurJ [Streptomyces sp. CBMA29]MBD0739008.1 virulence factor MviN [Streptomyces sp. CBMA29]
MTASAATAAHEDDAPTGRTLRAPGTAPGGGTDVDSGGGAGSGGGSGGDRGSKGLARAALVTAVLSVAGSVLGLVRDQAIAHLFGAGAASDAFLVSWTVPELAATVLIEDAMALLLVPAFAAALSRRADGRAADGRTARAGDPVRALLAATLPRLTLLLAAVGAAIAVAAPLVVDVLAPGLTDHRLAVDCTRLTAVTVFTFGLAGYLSAALRAHRRFLPPAAIYVAYNVGIIGTLFALHAHWGARAAAAGVAVGGLLMVLVQLPAFLAELRMGRQSVPAATAAIPEQPQHEGQFRDRARSHRAPRVRRGPPLPSRPKASRLGLALVAPVIFFTVSRQAQVLIERFFAAPLPSGAISHLNYAQKVAQMPMALSVMICTVTFPVVSQALARGDRERARRQVQRDLTVVCVVVLLGTAFIIGCAPQIIHVLFQRGAFDASDTAATAAVMRVYALGLLGQSLVGALIRPYFSAARPTWYPAAAMSAGLLVTIGADVATVGAWGAYGIAAGNAAGITVTAGLLVRGLAAHTIAIGARQLLTGVGRITLAAAVATAAGWGLGSLIPDPLAATAVCCIAVPVTFAAAAAAVRVPEVPHLLATAKRRLSHA